MVSGAVLHVLPAGATFDLAARRLVGFRTPLPDAEVAEVRAVGADPAVHRPRLDVVRLACPVGAGVDVVVLGGDDDVVRRRVVVLAGPVVEQLADLAGHPGAAADRQRTALTEVVLNVDDDRRTSCPEVIAEPPAADRWLYAALARLHLLLAAGLVCSPPSLG
jgi:hypothetical protein